MKKLVAGAAVAALLGSAAFADVNVGLSGQNVWAIGNGVNANGDSANDVKMANATNWGGDGTRNQISVEASNDNFGGKFAYNHNGDSDTAIDCGFLWYSPFEQLKIWAGKGTGDDIRGDACYSTWELFRVGTMRQAEGKNNAFHEAFTFQGQDSTGAKIGVFPIEGLKIFASLEYPGWNNMSATTYYDEDGEELDSADLLNGKYWDSTDNTWKEATKKTTTTNLAEILGRKSKYAIAYSIGGDDGIATIKVGLDTNPDRVYVKDGDEKKVKDQNIINAAVDLRPMDNLFISVGAFIPTVQKYYILDNSSEEQSIGNKVNLYGKFGATDELNIHAQVGTKIGTYKTGDKSDDYKKDGQLGLFFAAGVDYKLMEDLTLFGDVGYANGIYMSNSVADHKDCLNFGLGIQKSYDACSVSAGFVGATNGYGMYKTTYTDNGDTKYPFSWGIPLRVSYSF